MKPFPPNTALHVFYTTIAQKYELRDVFYLDLWPFGPSQMVLIAPSAADQVTVVKNYPLHDAAIQFIGPLIGKRAILATDGDIWKSLHRMISPGLRLSSIRPLMPIVAEKTTELFYPALTAYSSSGEVFSMEKAAAELIFSIISKMVLGGSLSKQKNSKLLHDIDQILDYAQSISMTGGMNPVKKCLKWWRKRKAAQSLDDFLRSFIEHRHLAYGDTNSDSLEEMSIFDHMFSEMNSKNHGELNADSVEVLLDK
jgi:cytochrome P450